MWYDNPWLSKPILFLLTIFAYVIGVWMKNKSRKKWMHPLVISSSIIITVLLVFDIPCDSYEAANRPFEILMGFSVVSLGWLLYDQIEYLKSNYKSIIVSSVVGCLVGMMVVSVVFLIFDIPDDVVISVLPKSVTAPIAISLSKSENGIAGLTAVIVFLTGIFGAVVGPFFLRKIGVTSRIARGLALGCSSHAIGTASAVELGAVEGAISGLAIGLSGAITALLFPIYVGLFY